MEATAADGVLAPLPGRCAFYVTKKKRYCKMTVGKGKTFCGEHANAVCLLKKYIAVSILPCLLCLPQSWPNKSFHVFFCRAMRPRKNEYPVLWTPNSKKITAVTSCGIHRESLKYRNKVYTFFSTRYVMRNSIFLNSTVYEDNLAKHLKKCNSKEKPKPVSFNRKSLSFE